MNTQLVNHVEVEKHDFSQYHTIQSNKKIWRYNIPAAFDIETTSLTMDGKKYSFMYIWMFGIDDIVYYGRTWDEFVSFIDKLSSQLDTFQEKRLVVFVHNLSFEFQFIYKLFDWHQVFSSKPHKPIYAVTESGIEFRCSYFLSGLKLEKVANNLLKHNLDKKVGDLDYSLIRHHLTPMTKKELGYCAYDILILLAYISEQIEEYDNNINYVPFTNTGRVRTFCRKQTLYKSHESYSKLMSSLTLTEDDYVQLKRAFQGGFTHANAYYSGKIMYNMDSYDFASSYPYVMVSNLFPMSVPKEVEIDSDDQLYNYLTSYCCLFDIRFTGIHSITTFEHPISESKCWEKKGALIDNGRVVEADVLSMTLTENDFFTIEEFYDWDTMSISNFKIMKKEYLPRSFILAILDLYGAKTSLKDVKGKEAEYMRSKNMINSTYGMTVTDIAKPEIMFQSTGEWTTEDQDLAKAIHKYNISKRRFLYYPWGVWVTSYARRNLFTGIYEFGDDYVYSDTDSIKVINADKHMDYIKKYNEGVLEKLKNMCETYSIDFDMVQPKAPNGKKKPLGVWDYDGHYDRFKTLGAKRYMIESNGKISITVSGVNKNKAVPYLTDKYGENIFDAFEEGLYIPPEHTGKLTHTYIDDEELITVTDYLGNTALVHTYSGVHLEPAAYDLSLSAAYVQYLKGIVDDVE